MLSKKFCASLGAAVFLASGQAQMASAQDSDDLVGTWSCSVSMSEEGMSMSGDYEYTFEDDQTFELNGEMKIDLAMPDLELNFAFDLNVAGTWRLEASSLFEKLGSVDVSSSSAEPSPIEQMILQQMEASFAGSGGTEEESTIVELTSDSLMIDDGGLHECERA